MDDLISRQQTIRFIREKISLSTFMKRSVDKADKACMELCERIESDLPSAQPYTDEEIQKIQDLHQAELGKAFELGREDAQQEIIRCKDCLMHGVCRFEQGLGLDGYCSKAERRTDG